MMIYIVHIYYSKILTSDEEHFEMPYNYCYGKGMTGQRKTIPPVPPPYKAK